MPRRTTPFAKGCYYHIYNRGAGRQPIVREERNYHYLASLLTKVAAECKVSVIAYCLLPNHYHWLLRQDGDTVVGEVPRRVFGSYSQAFNKAYRRTGTLFEGTYKAILVDSDGYLCRLCRYIHSNPVKHGLVAQPEDWPFSNYRAWIEGQAERSAAQAVMRAHFTSPAAYASFMREYLAGKRINSPSLPPELDEL